MTAGLAESQELEDLCRNQQFLLSLVRMQRELGDPDEIMLEAARSLAVYFDVNRCGFYDIVDDETVRFGPCWTDGTVMTFSGTHPIGNLGAALRPELKAGRGICISDTRRDPRTDDGRLAEVGTIAVLNIPILRKTRWCAGLYVCAAFERPWTVEEPTVAKEVAELTWDAVERARAAAEREAAIRALEASKERSRLLVESIRDYAILSLTKDGVIEGWNVGAEVLFQYAPADAIGQSGAIIFTSDDKALGAFQHEMEVARRQGSAIDERWHARKDGSRFYGSGMLAAIRDDKGHLCGFTKIIQDVTVRKKSEEMLLEARNAAEAANIAKTEFLANMSHEIRTPMNAIIGLSTLLGQSEPLTDRQRQFTKTLQTSAKALLDLLNDLLDITKIESRNIELETVPFDVSDLVEDVMAIAITKADGKDIAFSFETNCKRGDLHVGDPTRLRQVVMNLCGNAAKFTQQGSINVRLDCRPAGRAGTDLITISVQDTGPGIAADRLSHIFDKFTQADSSTTRKFGGTGLGLAITKTLTELMQGTIGVASTEGEGSTFTVCLPLPKAASTAMSGYRDGAHVRKPEGMTRGQSRVLVVEDHMPNVLVATSFLEKFGYAVDVAADGIEAVERVRTRSYGLILMDVQMPGLNGYDATRKIRDVEKEAGRTPAHIIGMTAHAFLADKERCLASGMDDYIAKPFDPEAFEAKLGRIARE
jgi:PAS domain S-box-containing protein